MDPLHVERLKEEQKKGLQLCEDKIKQWEKFKTDYEKLKQRLETLPDALSYDITVPFGPNAFSMGKLIHTNEVMVLLGDNWFAEVSGKQAVAIADRRIAQCCRMLDDLAKEKQQFDNWLAYIDEVSNENLVEIVEKYDEDEERKWREQHAKNVKAHRQKLAEEKISHCSEDSTMSNSDEEWIAMLENMELEETEQRELSESDESVHDTTKENVLCGSERSINEITEGKALSESEEIIHETNKEILSSETKINVDETTAETVLSLSEKGIRETTEVFKSEGNIHKSSNNLPQQCEKHSKPSLKLNINCANDQYTVDEMESGDEDGSKSDDVNSNLENCNSGSNGKHVRWQDLAKQNIKKITFRHSKSKLHTHPKHMVKRQISQDSSENEEQQPLIQSPSDIYKHFGSLFQAASPKSILKVKNSPTTPESNQSFFSVDDIVPKDSSPSMKSKNIVNAFTGKVYEHSSPTHIEEKKSSSRPVSHFKNSRKNRKR